MNRRELIRGIGRAMCAGATVPFLPSLLTSINGLTCGSSLRLFMEEINFFHSQVLENIKAHGDTYIVSGIDVDSKTIYIKEHV